MTPETLNKIAEWRRKEAEGTLTIEDLQEAVIYLRSDRTKSIEVYAASKSKSKKPQKTADQMLDELGL